MSVTRTPRRPWRWWTNAKALAFPMGVHWALSLLGFALFMGLVGIDDGIDDEWFEAGAVFLSLIVVGTGLGQLGALMRLRTVVFVTLSTILVVTGFGVTAYLGTLGFNDEVLVLVAVFFFLLPFFLATGLASLRVHMGLFAIWSGMVWIVGCVIYIAEEISNTDVNWHAGDKWAIWDFATLSVFSLGVVMTLMYLMSRETHRLHLWQHSPNAPDLPIQKAREEGFMSRLLGLVGLRRTGCGGLLALGLLAGGVTVCSAVVAPYLWRTAPRDGDGEDWDGDGIPDDDEDVNGDGDPDNDDSDGDGIPDYQDYDDDNDGYPTGKGGSDDPRADSDGDGIPDHRDPDSNTPDSDEDGINDHGEDTNGDGNPDNDDADGDGVPNYKDWDDDGDGFATGWGDSPSEDTDGDGTPDHLDPDSSTQDSDADGIPDHKEDLNGDGNLDNDDSDGDGTPNYQDWDDDNDGTATGPGDQPNRDSDGDGTPDSLDPDSQSDGQGAQQVVEVVKQAGISLLMLLVMLVLAILGILLFGPPIRRTTLLQHLRRPLWPVPPTRRIQHHWRLIEVALGDAGVHRQPGDTAARLVQRAHGKLPKQYDYDTLLEAAEIVDRVCYGMGVAPTDTNRAKRTAAMTYESVWELLSEADKIKAIYRML